MEEIKLADEVGLDVFAVGEHHRPDFAVSSPAVVLGGGGGGDRTHPAGQRGHRAQHGRSGARLRGLRDCRPAVERPGGDLGRARVVHGIVPALWLRPDDYDELFAEKLGLLLKVRDSERVTWSGKHRAPIDDRGVYPRPVQDPLPVWIAVGGNPGSVIRAGQLGLPLVLAIIGGNPRRFTPLIDLYRESAREAGHDPAHLPVAINSHGFIAENSQDAVDVFYPPYVAAMTKIGRERGWSPMTREQFDSLREPRGLAAGR